MPAKNLKINSPFGEFSIPYSEDVLLDLARKIQKVQEGEPNLLEEAVVDYLGVKDIDDTVSDWLFWEDTKVPIHIYDMMGWLKRDFDIEDIIAYSMTKRKSTGVQYHQFTYPHGDENMPIRATYFIKEKASGMPFVIDFCPVDGLHMEVQVMHLPEIRIENFHKKFQEYGTENGILRNNVVDAKLQFLQLDDVSWDDVVLSPDQRQSLERNIVKFISHISLYKSKNLPTSRGCLLTGPPGTGKTLTCSAVMNQVKSTIIYITSEDITERGQISDLYDIARKVSPTIVVVEDIDTLGGIDRNRAGGDHPILGEFLNCLAGVENNSGVVTIATTNYPEYLDKALVDRPGRFDFRIDFGLPDDKLREHILEKYLSTFNHKNIDLKPLVKSTKGMTGAHLKEMVMMAYMESLEASGYKKTTKITQKNLEQSMNSITTNRAKYNHYNKAREEESILHG
jgi:cell division protease FtsH|tara:strand:+ start:682 stop:2040 length:1359 start_codon:yes stop_codon:yes gene_type:complete